MNLPEDAFSTHERRDRLFLRWFMGALLAFLAAYAAADALAFIPSRFSVRHYAKKASRFHLPDVYDDYDPDLVLGIAIGDTRYRFNYATRHAIVTRPLFGVTDWVVPETVELRGERFDVTALDTFALLHAEGVQTLSLPPSLHYTNAAENFPPKSLRTLAMRQPDGSERVYSGAALPVPLIPGDPSGAEP